MKKKWLLGGVVVALLAVGGAGLVMSGKLKGTGLMAANGAASGAQDASAGKGGGKDGKKKPELPLEFVPREVISPSMARLPGVVEFSGPLVAPQTAIVRAKAGGTLLALSAIETPGQAWLMRELECDRG